MTTNTSSSKFRDELMCMIDQLEENLEQISPIAVLKVASYISAEYSARVVPLLNKEKLSNELSSKINVLNAESVYERVNGIYQKYKAKAKYFGMDVSHLPESLEKITTNQNN